MPPDDDHDAPSPGPPDDGASRPDGPDGFTPPLPPEDRLWRHPSEMATAPPGAASSGPDTSRGRRGLADPRLWLVAGPSALVGAVMTLMILAVGGTFDTTDDRTPSVGEVNISVPDYPGDSEVAMTAALAPSVVSVSATGPVSSANGTALVISPDGHLVTTADTVDGAQEITVTFADGVTSGATVVGIDADDDIAVIKVDRVGLTPIPIGDPDSLQLGARATVLTTAERAPGSSTVAVGLISGLGQQVSLGSDKTMHGLIQANVRLSSAESGAPLVDSTGAVIGLVTKRGQTGQEEPGQEEPGQDDGDRDGEDQGDDGAIEPSPGAPGVTETTVSAGGPGVTIRFAMSIDWVQDVTQDLIAQGHVEGVWLGIRGGELSTTQITATGHDGALVTEVTQNSPAAAAGIEEGDVIIALDGGDVASMSDLIVGIRRHDPGDAVTVQLLRDGTESQATVTLAPRVS